jgi:hypothetical protein
MKETECNGVHDLSERSVSAGSGSDRIKAQRAWMIHLAIAQGTDTVSPSLLRPFGAECS